MKRIGILVLLLSILTACQTIKYYEPPAELTAANAATILNSKVEKSSLVRDVWTSVGQVDGLPPRRQTGDRDAGLLLPEGEHDVMIIVGGGEHMLLSYRQFGSANIKANFRAGVVYVVRSTLVRISARVTEALVWIEEEDGTRIMEQFVVRMGVAQPTYIPIIIPAK